VVESPDNYNDAAYAKFAATSSPLWPHAHDSGATLAIEPYWRNVIDSAARAESSSRTSRPGAQLVMDPCNYYPQFRPAGTWRRCCATSSAA